MFLSPGRYSPIMWDRSAGGSKRFAPTCVRNRYTSSLKEPPVERDEGETVYLVRPRPDRVLRQRAGRCDLHRVHRAHPLPVAERVRDGPRHAAETSAEP